MREIGKGNERVRSDPQQFLQHLVGRAGGLQRLAQQGIVEAQGRIFDKIAIGVALHDRQALCDRLGDIGAFDLDPARVDLLRSEEHTSELQSLMRISYAVFYLKNKTTPQNKV